MSNNIKSKTVSGVGWSFAESILGQGVTFLVGIVLARLLSPDEYGLIGIITIFVTVLDSIVDAGFSNALIRKKEVSNSDYNTMFIANMAMSVLLFALLFFSAPAIADFFNRTELIPLTQAMASIIILHALSITQNTILVKKLDFKTRTKAALISSVLSGVIGIVMAFTGFGVWSLVGQQVSRRLLATFCLWFFNRWWPNFTFSKESFHYMWGFGWKILVSNIINNLWNELYQVVVGKCYSPATLGQYTRAREYARLLSANLTTVVQRVSFPAMAELQDERARMTAAYRKIIKVTMFVTAISMIFMGAVSEPLVYCLIGPKWHEASTYLPIICVTLSMYPLHAINLNMLQVENRSDLYLKLEIIKKAILIAPLCVGIYVDIYWMLITSVGTGIISFFLNSYYSGMKLGYTSWMQLRDVIPSYAIAFTLAVAVYFLKFIPISYFIILPLQIGVGSVLFFLLMHFIKLEEFTEIKHIATSFFNKLKKKK